MGWALYGWSERPLEAGRGGYYEVVARLVTAGAAVEPRWLAARSLVEKLSADFRMLAALRGEMPRLRNRGAAI